MVFGIMHCADGLDFVPSSHVTVDQAPLSLWGAVSAARYCREKNPLIIKQKPGCSTGRHKVDPAKFYFFFALASLGVNWRDGRLQ